MFSYHRISPGAIALAVLAAAAAQAEGSDFQEPDAFFPGSGPALAKPMRAVDEERVRSASMLNAIRADYAHARGLTGRGVVIGVLDTGVSHAHREFSDALRLQQGYNAVDGGRDVTDRSGHGTHVLGIAGASRNGKGMFGVAYEATLLPVKVFPDSGQGSTTALDHGLRYVSGRAAIANLSVGSTGPYNAGATRDAVRAGLLLVASAGNQGEPNPGWPARFAREAWANNQIIAVGAVDQQERIASFSNRAGDTAAWYLVAPGTGISSAYPADRYVSMSGTSMAAPLVSGAAALLKQRWPALRADQLATILFVTATDLGAPGIDPVYGRGLLNIERALQPVGPLTATTLNGRMIRVLAGSMQPSPAASALWNLAASGQLRVSGFDDFERDFGVDLGATLVRPIPMSLESAIGSIDQRIEVVDRLFANGLRMTSVVERPRFSASGGVRLSSFMLLAKDADGDEFSFGVGGMAEQVFGAGTLQMGQGWSFAQETTLANPYFTLVPHASHAAMAQDLGTLKLRFGILSSGLHPLLATQDHGTRWGLVPKANAGLLELSRSFDSAALSVSVSQTRETHAYLGSYATGALSLGSEASTNAFQVSGAFMLAPKLALAGQAAYGLTPGGRSRDRLVTEISTARTNAFSLALVAADRLRPGDRLSFSLSQPMRAYAGRIVMESLSRGGGVRRERLVFSMVPIGREMRVQLNYRMPAGLGASFGVTALVRRNPNNLADASVEKLVALRYQKTF